MNDMTRVRKFIYRHCRVKAGFTVDFLVGSDTFHGVCRDASDAGIRAEFDGSVVVGSSGLLVLHKPAGVLKLEARVAYMDRGQVGLDFTFKANPEHGRIVEFVAPNPIGDHK